MPERLGEQGGEHGGEQGGEQGGAATSGGLRLWRGPGVEGQGLRAALYRVTRRDRQPNPPPSAANPGTHKPGTAGSDGAAAEQRTGEAAKESASFAAALQRLNQDFRTLKAAVEDATAHHQKLAVAAAAQAAAASSPGDAEAQAALETARLAAAEVGVEVVEVGYRQNRCVAFESSLIHETLPVRFKPGYQNRRINLTFMFGNAKFE